MDPGDVPPASLLNSGLSTVVIRVDIPSIQHRPSESQNSEKYTYIYIVILYRIMEKQYLCFRRRSFVKNRIAPPPEISPMGKIVNTVYVLYVLISNYINYL